MRCYLNDNFKISNPEQDSLMYYISVKCHVICPLEDVDIKMHLLHINGKKSKL